MDSVIKIFWKDKTARLIKESYASQPYNGDIKSLALEAARIAEASAAILLKRHKTGKISLEASLDPSLKGSLNIHEIFEPWFVRQSITIEKITNATPASPSKPYNLTIPIKSEKSDKILILGFDKSPKNKAGLILFAETVQSLLLAAAIKKPFQKGANDFAGLRATSILEKTNEYYLSINKDYQLVCISPLFQKIIYKELGLHLDAGSELPIHTFSKFFIADTKAVIEKALEGENLTVQCQRLHYGIKNFYEFAVFPIRNSQNDIIEIAIIGKTIPVSQKSKSRAKQKNLVLKSILSYLPVIIYRINADGYFLELRGEGLRKLNIHNNEMVGKSALKIFPNLQNLISTITTGISQRLVIQGAEDNAARVFKNYTFPDYNNGGGIVGFAIDVTEQDANEQQLKRSKDQAEKASLAKSHFLANQSHEIRTPINAIVGFAQLMKNNLYSSESEEYIDYILSSGQILLNLIGNVLDLTKIEEGKLDLVEEPFYIQEVISSNLYPYKFQAKEKGLDFILDFDPKLPKYLIGDAGKILQIIINLIGNSLKFTKEGYIKVYIKCLTPSVKGKKTTIKIEVSDSGIGIPLEKQQSIFDSFTQADASINRKYGGSGLGLSIVKALTNLMNGKLEVMSSSKTDDTHQNTGTTILVHLPLQVAFPPSVEIDDTEENDINYNGHLKILLVDDNYLNLRLASTMLNNLGCDVSISHNGREAIQELNQNTFDLVFMDVQMPVMDGYETTKLIRNKLKLDIPIIGLSANVYKEDIDHCYESGMDDYLARPYTIKSFHEKVFKWAPPLKRNNYDNNEQDREETSNLRLTNLTFLEQVFNGDKEKVIETAKDFIEHNEKMINMLETAIRDKDFNNIASVAHNIRSSLQTVGLDCLFEILTDIELIAKGNKNLILLEKYYKGVKEISEKANIELKESLIIRQK